ncbi:L-2,4-diaminobutyrate decarboxylase [Leminorella richardii]|uniref:L-2,4-diaminobutyrate decarboxylase n=1 Tax=Leminorella richardii TaxID=158841 RepID=A0A2X4V6Q4_9GAMM|nr:aspartate aminotransferase family protein [Leminorella richardii]SQI40960.1 L-2,4-diaminobutyrate decarboxylase [Leminorella richardii]
MKADINTPTRVNERILEAAALQVLRSRTTPQPRVIRMAVGEELDELRTMTVPMQGRPLDEVIEEMVEKVYYHRAQADHPRFFAFVPGPSSPISAIGDFLTATYNPHAGNWLESSGPSCIELQLIQWLAGHLGLPESCGGLFVSGGSMANLTAMVAARDQKLPVGKRSKGVAYVSEQTHSSVSKGLKIIGFLPEQIRRIKCNEHFQLDIQDLADAIAKDRAAGLVPFAVIASAGTTNTGSIDPLPIIRSICDRENLWMHVDGAYGASVAISPRYRHLLKGIESADSISWDGHKWLFQTYGCGVVIVRNREHLMSSFHTRPEYLRDTETNEGQVNFWDMGVELTRPARGLKLWLTLQTVGSVAMANGIEHGFQLARWAEDELKQHRGWEIISPAQLAIVNFRYVPEGWEKPQIDSLNKAISQRLLQDGYATVLTTDLNGKTVLRICAIHPDATEQDMRQTICKLTECAKREIAGF